MTLTPNNYGNNGYSKTQTNDLLNEKQDTLVSGTNIKTINGNTVLGNGNIEIGEGGTITVDQIYDPTSIHAQSGVAVADALSNSIEMVTQNGTISNCILEIPQLLKLELSDNVITHKAGSIQTQCGDTYATYTLTQDRSTTISNSLADGLYFVNPSNNGTLTITAQEKFGSGDSLPADGTIYERFFLTTDKKMYHYGAGTWSSSGLNYPVCMIKMTSGVASFAKDSNGNDMIFNGAGFIGHHAFVLPNVVSLRPNKKDTKERLQSYYNKTNALIILELNTNTNMVTISGNSQGVVRKYKEVDVFNPNDTAYFQYVKSENADYFYSGSGWAQRSETPFIEYSYNGTTVTSFTINKVVRLATTEMLDKVQDQIDTKQDTLISGTNIKTINNNSILSNGNIALADQSLSNLNSTGQMIVDSQNGTISNCVLDIPQNLKLEFSNGTVTLKAGSIITRTGSTYSTVTTTQDVTWSTSTQANVKQYLFATAYGFTIGLYGRCNINKVGSGDTLPANGSTYLTFYNTTDKIIYMWNPDTSQWESTTTCYPLGIIEIDSQSHITGFAKDSNGNDMIFNGAGFIGHHAFVYPNVKALIPDGFNDDGSMKSISVTRSALTIREIVGNQYFSIGSATAINPRPSYFEVNTLDDLYAKNLQGFYYVKSLNQCYSWGGGSGVLYAGNCVFIHVNISGEIVTDFTIRQPVRTATVEMLKDKQNDLTTVSGYDATTTQVLKNINGVLTWVTEE